MAAHIEDRQIISQEVRVDLVAKLKDAARGAYPHQLRINGLVSTLST